MKIIFCAILLVIIVGSFLWAVRSYRKIGNIDIETISTTGGNAAAIKAEGDAEVQVYGSTLKAETHGGTINAFISASTIKKSVLNLTIFLSITIISISVFLNFLILLFWKK